MKDRWNLNMNEYLPLRDVVFQTLRQAIITGEFAPGERLMEITLAERLGVSRTPVREAIRKLELEGLVVMIPRKGAEVAKITEERLRDVLEVRCALEELSATLACQRIDEEGKERLAACHDAFVRAVKMGDALEIANQDEAFHECIFEQTRNDRLLQIIHNLKEQMYRYRMEYVKDASYREELVAEHEKLLGAILSGDTQTATEVMRHHIHNQETMILNHIRSNKEAEKE